MIKVKHSVLIMWILQYSEYTLLVVKHPSPKCRNFTFWARARVSTLGRHFSVQQNKSAKSVICVILTIFFCGSNVSPTYYFAIRALRRVNIKIFKLESQDIVSDEGKGSKKEMFCNEHLGAGMSQSRGPSCFPKITKLQRPIGKYTWRNSTSLGKIFQSDF